MRRVPRAAVLPVVPLLLTGALAGCSSKSKPAVCGDVTSLKSSVQSLSDISLSQGALTKLTDDLAAVRDDLTKLKADAGSQYATQIADLHNALNTLGTDLRLAVASPTATSLAAVASATSAVGTAAKTLSDAVASTC